MNIILCISSAAVLKYQVRLDSEEGVRLEQNIYSFKLMVHG